MRRLACLATFCLVTAAGVARAEGPPTVTAWDRRPTAMQVELGIGTPTGLYGMTVDHAISTRTSIYAGVGTNNVGPQLAVGARGRTLIGRGSALYAAGALSAGGHEDPGRMFNGGPRLATDLALWANGEIGFESRAVTGFTFRLYAGLGFLTNPGDLECRGGGGEDGGCAPADDIVIIPYLGTAFGYAF